MRALQQTQPSQSSLQGRPKRPRLEVMSAEQYLARRGSASRPVQGLLPRVGHAMLYAPTGHLKSFAAVHLAGCIATGQPFGGRAVEQGEVLYVAAEAPEELAKRIHGREEYYKAPRRSIVMPERAVLRVDREHDLEDLREYLDSRQGRVRLVVFDTIRRCVTGLDEDKASEVYDKVNTPLTEIASEHRLCALVLHHTGKNPNLKTPRGSAAWTDACDTVIRLDTQFQDARRRMHPKRTRLIVEKLRSGEPSDLDFKVIAYHQTLVVTSDPDDKQMPANDEDAGEAWDGDHDGKGKSLRAMCGARRSIPLRIAWTEYEGGGTQCTSRRALHFAARNQSRTPSPGSRAGLLRRRQGSHCA